MTAVEENVEMPSSFLLMHNYPNPFNPETTIGFELPHAGLVAITIYNLLGQEIRNLTNTQYPAGRNGVRWDGNDNSGNPANSGIYIYQLRTDGFSEMKKMTLLR